MPRGAKKGENRFKKRQKRLLDQRRERITDVVIPTIQSYAGKISLPGKAAYCKLCAEIFNRDLPVNEEPIGYRTIEQNIHYWSLLGPLYHRHWWKGEDIERETNTLRSQLTGKENQLLRTKIDELQKQNTALQAALRNHGAGDQQGQDSSLPSESQNNLEFEFTCRALKILIDASEGSFEIDEEAKKITRTWDDLEAPEGLIPKALIEPFFKWLHKRQKKMVGDDE